MAQEGLIKDVETRKELSELFGTAVEDHEDVMLECLNLCRLYSLPPSELYYKHEAYILNLPSTASSIQKNLSLEVLKELKSIVQREQQLAAMNTNGGAGGVGVGGSGTSGGGAAKGTPKAGGAMGMRKALGGNGDLGGFLDSLSTPSRPSPASTSLRRPHPYAKDSPTGASPLSSTSTPNKTSPATASGSSLSRPATDFSTPSRPAFSSKVNPNTNAKSSNQPTSSPLPFSIPTETSTPSVPFAHRLKPLDLLETLNSHLSPATGIPPYPAVSQANLNAASKAQQRVKLSMTARPDEWEYRYMFEKISERSEMLDNGIEEFAEGFREMYGIGELGDPGSFSEESVYVVGRIISTQTDSGKPTDSSLLLESSRALGDGKRVPLRFSPNVKVRGNAPGSLGFGLFKGCLVGLKGRNGGGGSFMVEEVLLPLPSEMHVTPPSQLIQYQHDKMGGQPISVMLGAGPFTLDTDVLFEPLDALMEAARTERPDVLILLGPFIDSQHPLIKVGDIDETPIDLFRSQVASRITLFSESCPGCSIILLPSVRDLISRHVAFPQAPLDKAIDLGLPKRVRLLPNPCSFFINEIMISVASVDVLFHLRKEEYFRKAEEAEPDEMMKGNIPKDSMADLCRHVLGQKSFYPIFPVPEDVASEINLDITHQHLIRMEDRAPDILILPSRLRHFAKIVDSIVAVNPGFLSKSANPGTFVKMAIHPMERGLLNRAREGGDADRAHKVYERARVEVLRI